ncbi:MAG: RIP metalloprotease RseP [Aggregatilineales bacterium]
MELSSLVGFLYAVVAFGLVLIPAIIIHELGHFFAARAVGINVLEFGIGFPPKIVRLFRWRETDFTLNWIPLGGFVRPLGEDMIGPVDEKAAEEKTKNDGDEAIITEREELISRGVPPEKLKSVNEARPLQRIVFMAAGAFANFASAFVFLIIVALLGLPEFLGARVQILQLNPDSAEALAGMKQQDAIERVNGEYFASMEAFAELYAAAAEPLELQMRSFDTQETYTVVVRPSAVNRPEVLVLGVAEGTPADGKLQVEDVITHIGGQAFPTGAPASESLLRYIAENAGREITLTIRRGSRTFDVKLVPHVEPPPGQGRVGIAIANLVNMGDMIITVANPQTRLVPQPFDQSVAYAFNQMKFVFNQIISLPGLLVQGRIDPELARPVSIVGISQIGGRFLQQSVDEGRPGIILEFIALVSIFLGITNLLPIPPLDGGRIVFVLVEMVRGKPVPVEIELTVYKIGLFFLLALGILVIFWDILRPIQIP